MKDGGEGETMGGEGGRHAMFHRKDLLLNRIDRGEGGESHFETSLGSVRTRAHCKKGWGGAPFVDGGGVGDSLLLVGCELCRIFAGLSFCRQHCLLMEKFQVHILGCGSALPTTKHYPTSQVVDLRDKLFMIDCAEGTQLLLRRQKLRFSRLNHIFISHLHGDHCFGLMGLISTFNLLGRTAKLHLYSPTDDLKRLLHPWLNYFCKSMTYEIVFHTVDYRSPSLVYEDRTVAITTIPLKHRIPCCGYLFREHAPLPHIRRDMIDFLNIPFHAINSIKQGGGWTDGEGRHWKHEQLVVASQKRGRSYAYCSDTIYLPQLAEQLNGVDLLFHEATFADDALKRAQETFHTTARQAALLAKEARVGRLLIGHFSARYDDERLLLEQAQEVFPATLLARDGMQLSVE